MTDLPPQEPLDPLDEALRRQLSDYGEPPSPRVWAGVRRNLPGAAPPRPRWQRRLPWLLLGLLPALLATLWWLHASRPRVEVAAGATPSATAHSAAAPRAATPSNRRDQPVVGNQTGAAAELAAAPTRQTGPAASAPARGSVAAPATAEATEPTALGQAAGFKPLASASPVRHGQTEKAAPADGTRNAPNDTGSVATTPARTPIRRGLALESTLAAGKPGSPGAGSAERRRADVSRAAARGENPGTGAKKAARLAGIQAGAGVRAGEVVASVRPAFGETRAGQRPRASRPGARQTAVVEGAALASANGQTRNGAGRKARQEAPAGGNSGVAEPAGAASSTPGAGLETPATPAAAAAASGEGFAQLAYKTSGLLLRTQVLPAPLGNVPADSVRPPLLRRRWAVQVLAGPTLSYRTLNQPPQSTGPEVARLERPALGLGAQVQLRRVLNGRWALAAGLGYQQYATALALQVRTRTDSSQTTRSVYSRDTYNLLTVPVQLSYALGLPGRRFGVGLLGGAEAGRYLGGRSTGGSNGSACDCEQQTYSGPDNSPYRPWSLALSLGLDLRYRLGGSAGRWQVLAQPTARYVVSPFVRPAEAAIAGSPNAAADYSRRPYSLGLLLGVGWDLR